MHRQNPVNKCLDLVFGKHVSGYDFGKQVSGNRCLNMAKGNRCQETGVLIPCGNRCRGNRCLDSIVTEH